VAQWVLSAQVDTSEKLQLHNLFQIFFIIKDCRVRTIIDRGRCNNLVSTDFVAMIGLTTHLHTHPYYIQWLNNSSKAKITHTAHVHLSIGTYHDYADCDVKHVLFYWVVLGSFILMLYTMVEVTNTLSCTTKKNYFASIDTE
jgi:hypothetical protein